MSKSSEFIFAAAVTAINNARISRAQGPSGDLKNRLEAAEKFAALVQLPADEALSEKPRLGINPQGRWELYSPVWPARGPEARGRWWVNTIREGNWGVTSLHRADGTREFRKERGRRKDSDPLLRHPTFPGENVIVRDWMLRVELNRVRAYVCANEGAYVVYRLDPVDAADLGKGFVKTNLFARGGRDATIIPIRLAPGADDHFQAAAARARFVRGCGQMVESAEAANRRFRKDVKEGFQQHPTLLDKSPYDI